MIGLDFVKHVDKDWRKHLTYIDGSSYYEDYCPLGNCKCRREDCTFWNHVSENCRYIIKSDIAENSHKQERNQTDTSIIDVMEETVEEKVDEILAKIQTKEKP